MSNLRFPLDNFNDNEHKVIFEIFEPGSATYAGPNPSGDEFTRNGGLISTIVMHAPNAILENNSHRYRVVNARLVNAIKSIGSGNVGDILGGLGTAIEQIMPDAFVVGFGLKNQTTQNPVEEQFYQAPNFRTHQFSYELAASSAAETEVIHDIVDTFRASSYPVLKGGFGSEGTTRYQFPRQFKIRYVRGNKQGKVVGLGSPAKCVLTAINVNYTGAGIPVSYSSGKSAFVNLEMTFTETNLQTRDSKALNQGY